MSQLLVRNIEESVVTKLRQRASDMGVSVEEAHRQLLLTALNNEDAATNLSFTQHLLNIPKVPEDDYEEFPRGRDLPRVIEF